MLALYVIKQVGVWVFKRHEGRGTSRMNMLCVRSSYEVPQSLRSDVQ